MEHGRISRNMKSVSSGSRERKIIKRVRSWLRMNAGGVPNTCKSSGVQCLSDFGQINLYLAADG